MRVFPIRFNAPAALHSVGIENGMSVDPFEVFGPVRWIRKRAGSRLLLRSGARSAMRTKRDFATRA